MDQKHPYKDEIDWKDLIRRPTKLFGYSYIYILLVIVAIGLMYISNLTTIGKNAVTMSPTDTLVAAKDIPLQSPRIMPPIDVLKASVSTPALIEKGKDLFKTNCASCHGDNGTGDGPAALLLNPKPRNFTVLSGWKNGSKISQIYKTLEEGVPGSGMASYNFLSPADRFALIHYVRSLATNQPQDSIGELKQLDATYQLSKGVDVPGQIPIKKAMALIEKESAGEVADIQETKQRVMSDSTDEAQLFRSVVDDETKAITVLLNKKMAFQNVNTLVDVVAENPLQCGFKPSVTRLTAIEWKSIYHYIQTKIR